MRLLVALALALTVLLSLPSTMAIHSGTVGNGSQVAVVSTDSAYLALTPGVGGGNAAGTASYRDSVARDALILDFTRGLNAGTTYGFPPNSLSFRDQFRFRGLFTVTNRSDETLCLSIYVPGGDAADLDGIYVRSAGDTGTGTLVAGPGGSPLTCSVPLTAGSALEVDFWWEVGSSTEGVRSFEVRVEGSR
ncbi:MAG: hypothetical protein ACOY93_09085 [Bacillota bacterium]